MGSVTVLDNIDTSIPWLNDRLSTIATGNAITLRELYTTNSEKRIYPRCILCLSSRTPHFRRDDVADRLLIFRVKRIPSGKNIPERKLLSEIETNRNYIIGQLLKKLNIIVSYLKTFDINNETMDFRLADFASLGKAIWRALDGEDGAKDWDAILHVMKNEQEDFAIEGDTLPEVIMAWMGNKKEKGPIDPFSLFQELSAIAQNRNIEFTYRDSRAVGNRLNNIKSNLERVGIRIKDRKGHANKTLRVFTKIDSVEK